MGQRRERAHAFPGLAGFDFVVNPRVGFFEAFAQADPYVREGLVLRWRVREWTTVVGDLALQPLPPPASGT